MITESLRAQMEYNIVCTCIYVEHAYAAVCNIINPKHFADKKHRAVMQTIEAIWPNPIDFITIWNANSGVNLLQYNSAETLTQTRLMHHCFNLVEHDVMSKFSNLLAIEALNSVPKEMRVVSAAIGECIDLLQKQEEDVFTCIDASINYLKSLNTPTDVVAKLEDFSRNVDRGITQMKKAKQVDALLSAIIDLSGKAVPAHNVLVAQEIAQCLAACFLVGPMPADVLAAISTLKKTLKIS